MIAAVLNASRAASTPNPEPFTSGRSPLKSAGVIFLVALAIRLVTMLLIYTAPLGRDSPIWRTGPEMVNVAASIAAHRGFSSPFGPATGPTAWLPPVYPYLLASIFRIAGTRSSLSGFIILGLQALFSALICLVVYRIAYQAFGRKIAVAAAWAWALYPYSILIPVLFIWETTLSALLLSVVLAVGFELHSDRVWNCIVAGLLWGVAALTNTALLSVLPFTLVWNFGHSTFPERARRALIVMVVAFVVVAPWMIRNWRVFHALVPVRSNFGEELWLGNHAGSTGRIAYGAGPLENPAELHRYEELGEITYNRQRQQEATAFIFAHQLRFVYTTLYRIAYWWVALGELAPIFVFYVLLGVLTLPGAVMAWRARNPSGRMIVVAVMVFPLIYYFTDVYARYRYPVEPLMMILASCAVVPFAEKVLGRIRRKRSA